MSTKRGKILIIDDSSMNRTIIDKVLAKQHEILNADSGSLGLELAQKEKPDLILLDIVMPGMDGYTVCRRLKNNELTRNIPVIFITAKDAMEDLIDGFKVGGVDYITKPFHAEELILRVATHVELKKSREELLTKNRQMEDMVRKLDMASRTDPLTGLYNRRHLMAQIKQLTRKFEGGDCSVLMADLDNFKAKNDTYGHVCGDKILKETAQRMKNFFPEEMVIARWGGEEFLILMPKTPKEKAFAMAEAFRALTEREGTIWEKARLETSLTLGGASWDWQLGISTERMSLFMRGKKGEKTG